MFLKRAFYGVFPTPADLENSLYSSEASVLKLRTGKFTREVGFMEGKTRAKKDCHEQ